MINDKHPFEFFANERLAELHTALQWSSEHELHETALTVGERIMVNQERAAIFRHLDGQPVAFVQLPEITNKLIRIQYLIERTGWCAKY